MNRLKVHLLAIAVVALAGFLPQRAAGAGTNESLIFRVGLSSACFRNVNRNDVVAAYRVFVEATGRRYGNVFRAETEVFDDASSFELALSQQPKHLAVIEAWQYLTMDVNRLLQPLYGVVERGKAGRKYVVLARRDSGIHSLADLREKKILELKHAHTSVGTVWLNSLLRAANLERAENFFAAVDVVEKPIAAVLPVFFGKYSACLVDESAFEIMKELNPQVGQTLQVVAESEPFADVVVCVAIRGWESEKLRADTIKSLGELHLQPTGQQILTLFKIDRMVPFEESQLDTIRKLRAGSESLTNKATL